MNIHGLLQVFLITPCGLHVLHVCLEVSSNVLSVFKFGSGEFECSMSICSGYLCFMWATRVLGCFMSVGKWNLHSFRFKRTLELHGGFLLIFLYA